MRRLLRTARARVRQVRDRLAWSVRRRVVARKMRTAIEGPEAHSLAGATLFFLPYAGVTPMMAQACVVARTLAERGHHVVFTRCFRLFERCPVIDMHLLPFDAPDKSKLESCLRCGHQSLETLSKYGLDAIDLRTVITPEITAILDEALANAPADLMTFQYDGVPFGTLAVMDIILARKISDLSQLTESDRTAWRQYLRSSLLAYLLIDRLCREYGIARVVHVNDYSLLLGARMGARKNGVPCYGLAFPGHCNIDFRRYLVLSNVWKPFSFKLLAQWPACRDWALEPHAVREVVDDLIVRLGGAGSHIYSSGKTLDERSVPERFGLSRDRRLLVAYTSSLDESIATTIGMEALGIPLPKPSQPFADQIEWLRALIDYVERSDDLQLIVRIHPRESANKREGAVSQHLSKLREAFDKPYRHCRFVWPQNPVSSYDLGEAADLVLTSWSTIGLEMARLGAPVLIAFSGWQSAIPCDDFLEWAPTPAEYFEKLRLLLDRPVSLGQIARAFRWYHLLTLGTTVDFGDVVPQADFSDLPPWRMPAEAATLERILIGGEDVCDVNIGRLRDSQQPESSARETAELERQIRRLIHFLMTGRDADDVLETEAAPRLQDRTSVEYRDGNRLIRRNSQMAARLVRALRNAAPEPSSAGAAR